MLQSILFYMGIQQSMLHKLGIIFLKILQSPSSMVSVDHILRLGGVCGNILQISILEKGTKMNNI